MVLTDQSFIEEISIVVVVFIILFVVFVRRMISISCWWRLIGVNSPSCVIVIEIIIRVDVVLICYDSAIIMQSLSSNPSSLRFLFTNGIVIFIILLMFIADLWVIRFHNSIVTINS